jgi:hypothetical protein
MGCCSTKARAVDSQSQGFRGNLVRHQCVKNITDLFDIEETLGEGMTGSVKACRDIKTGQRYALKSISKSRVDRDALPQLLNEIEILKGWYCGVVMFINKNELQDSTIQILFGFMLLMKTKIAYIC